MNMFIRLSMMFWLGLLLGGCFCSPTTKFEYGNLHMNNNITIQRKMYVDANFTGTERKLIQDAANNIEHATKGIVKFDLVFNYDLSEEPDEVNGYTNKIVIRKLTSKSQITQMIDEGINKELSEENGGEDLQAYILGYTLKRPGFTYILIVSDRIVLEDKKNLDLDGFVSVVMHETLHSIGMSHDDTRRAIMNSQYEYTLAIITGVKQRPLMCLTETDLENFCDLYICDPEKLNHC